MHSPLRSEADAFRWIVVIGIGAASVIAVTLLTRPAIGAAWATGLVGFSAGFAWRSVDALPGGASAQGGGDGRRRILVVADQTLGSRELLREIENRSRGGRSEILVVAPAPDASGDRSAADLELVRQRLELFLQAIEESGRKAQGRLGDPEPGAAIEEALREFAAHEIIIATHPPDCSRWLQNGGVEAARSELGLPVAHVVVDPELERPAGR